MSPEKKIKYLEEENHLLKERVMEYEAMQIVDPGACEEEVQRVKKLNYALMEEYTQLFNEHYGLTKLQ
jgi:hypothetical protein